MHQARQRRLFSGSLGAMFVFLPQSVKKMRLVVALDSLSGLRDSEDGEDVIYFHRKTAKSTSNNQLQELLKFQQVYKPEFIPRHQHIMQPEVQRQFVNILNHAKNSTCAWGLQLICAR